MTEESYAHFVILGIARLEKKSREPQLKNSRVASCDKYLLGLSLGHSTVVARRGRSSRLVMLAQGGFQKDLWIDWKEIPAGNQKKSFRLIKETNRSLRSRGCAETLSRQR
jgi:hypothetical protein